MTTATKEYIESRQEWVRALNAECTAKADLEKARYKFVMARDTLRAEERELLEARVTS